MAKKVLLTGEAGFIGSHLIRQPHAFEIVGSGFELLDSAAVERTLAREKPDCILHLAAISLPAECDSDPERAHRVNVEGTVSLCEVAARVVPGARIVFASTAQVYKPMGPEGGEIDEGFEVAPINLYARTKYEAEERIRAQVARGAIRAVILRIFNHVHKSQKAGTFLSSLYQHVLRNRGAPGSQLETPVGNLDLYRDMGSIEDLLGAMDAILARESAFGPIETINLCNGRPRKLRSLAEELFRQLDVKPDFKVDPSRFRPGEPEKVVGSHRHLTELTGWSPRTITDSDLIREFLKDV